MVLLKKIPKWSNIKENLYWGNEYESRSKNRRNA